MEKEYDEFEEYIRSEKTKILKDLLTFNPKTKEQALILNRAYYFIKHFCK